MTTLERFKEDARQFNLAKIQAKNSHKAILVYIRADGSKVTWYWNGATYVDRKSALHEDRYMQGTITIPFKKSQNW